MKSEYVRLERILIQLIDNTTGAPKNAVAPRTFVLATLASRRQLLSDSCSPMSLGICYAFFSDK